MMFWWERSGRRSSVWRLFFIRYVLGKMLTAHRVSGGVLRPEEASYMNLVLRMARRLLPSRLALMGAASAGTLGLVGLVALAGAAIPSSDGAINGCYDKANGQLRVIDTDKAACKN